MILVHRIVHLGHALEFQQPGLVAEALAAACVYDNWPKEFLLPTEEHIRSNKGMPSRSPAVLHVIDSLHHNPEIASAGKDSDPFNKIRDGLLKRGTAERLVPHLR